MVNGAPEEYVKKLTSVLNITKAFRTITHIDVLLQTIVDTASRVIGAKAGSILLFDDSGELWFRTSSGERSDAVKPLRVATGQGVAGWCAESAKAAIINDAPGDPRFDSRFDEATGFTTRSILCVPLQSQGKVLGVLELLNKHNQAGLPSDFDDSDLELLFHLADQAASSIERARLQDAQSNYFSHVVEILMGVMDQHDPEKSGHARRVAHYARSVAKGLGLSETEQKALYFAGLLHDIGLLKLDPAEGRTRDQVQLHPLLGYEMVKDIVFWRKLAPLILHHHERWDGGGYPDHLEGPNIPLGSRIIAACEALDVLTSSHSYRSPLPFDLAVKELEQHAGTQFDPEVVRVLSEKITKEDTEAWTESSPE